MIGTDYKKLYARLQKLDPSLPANPKEDDKGKFYFEAFFKVEKNLEREKLYLKIYELATDEDFKSSGKKSRLGMLEEVSHQLDDVNTRVIKGAMDDPVCLDLSGKGITRFPNWLLTNPAYKRYWLGLKKLNLKNNHLRMLPKEFEVCQALEKLNCSGNKLTELPNSLAKCTNLETLNFNYNDIKTISLSLVLEFGWEWAKDGLKNQRGKGLPHKPVMAVNFTPSFKRTKQSSGKCLTRQEYFKLLGEASISKKGITP